MQCADCAVQSDISGNGNYDHEQILEMYSSKLQKPAMSLKQFMLRTEVIKLYKGFMRLGRLIDAPPACQSSSATSAITSNSRNPMQVEWIDWVRSEFRLRQSTDDEEAIRMMLSHGKRQLQELERTILLASNKNSTSSVSSTTTSNSMSACKASGKTNK